MSGERASDPRRTGISRRQQDSVAVGPMDVSMILVKG
jgi:hypothetical protein